MKPEEENKMDARPDTTTTTAAAAVLSPFLSLPLELRLQIYRLLFAPASALKVRSLFIRTGYRNVFMTQAPRRSSSDNDGGDSIGAAVGLLRVCRRVNAEATPLLYALPLWMCGCRVEALATQIGTRNFGFIRRMGVDVDDLDLLVECARIERQKQVHRSSGFAMQDVRIPADMIGGVGGGVGGIGQSMSARTLNFSNLEILEVEGYQSAALSSHGSHRIRIEALRLCELAAQLLDFHPLLSTLLQRRESGDGGADARDLTLGRVRWRFVKDVPVALSTAVNPKLWGDVGHEEYVVDPKLLRPILDFMLTADESVAQRESSLPVAWTSSATGRFHLYPFLPTT